MNSVNASAITYHTLYGWYYILPMDPHTHSSKKAATIHRAEVPASLLRTWQKHVAIGSEFPID